MTILEDNLENGNAPKNEADLKNLDDPKNEDYPKNEDKPKEEDGLKNEDNPKHAIILTKLIQTTNMIAHTYLFYQDSSLQIVDELLILRN